MFAVIVIVSLNLNLCTYFFPLGRLISCLDSPDFLNLTDLQHDERNIALFKYNLQGTGLIDAISAENVRINDQVIISDGDSETIQNLERKRKIFLKKSTTTRPTAMRRCMVPAKAEPEFAHVTK